MGFFEFLTSILWIRIRIPSTESCVINKRVATSDGNVERGQRSLTGEAAFPYGTTNTQRLADTLERLSSSSSSSHHHERTICSEQIRALILLRFCIFRFHANEGRRGIYSGFIWNPSDWFSAAIRPSAPCSAAGCPADCVQGITANWEVLDWQVHWCEIARVDEAVIGGFNE